MFSPRIPTAVSTAFTVAAIGLAGATGVATAGAAAAEVTSTDDVFVAQANSRGIHLGSPQEVVRQGHQVCAELAAGKTKAAAAIQMVAQAKLSGRQAGYFVAVATNAFCPQF